jgi:hypothetical protein
MQDALPVILTSLLIVLSLVLTVVGVQLFMTLMEFKRTLKKVNEAVDVVENRLVSITASFQSLGGAVTGMRTGFKVFELFVSWLNRNKDRND